METPFRCPRRAIPVPCAPSARAGRRLLALLAACACPGARADDPGRFHDRGFQRLAASSRAGARTGRGACTARPRSRPARDRRTDLPRWRPNGSSITTLLPAPDHRRLQPGRRPAARQSTGCSTARPASAARTEANTAGTVFRDCTRTAAASRSCYRFQSYHAAPSAGRADQCRRRESGDRTRRGQRRHASTASRAPAAPTAPASSSRSAGTARAFSCPAHVFGRDHVGDQRHAGAERRRHRPGERRWSPVPTTTSTARPSPAARRATARSSACGFDGTGFEVLRTLPAIVDRARRRCPPTRTVPRPDRGPDRRRATGASTASPTSAASTAIGTVFAIDPVEPGVHGAARFRRRQGRAADRRAAARAGRQAGRHDRDGRHELRAASSPRSARSSRSRATAPASRASTASTARRVRRRPAACCSSMRHTFVGVAHGRRPLQPGHALPVQPDGRDGRRHHQLRASARTAAAAAMTPALLLLLGGRSAARRLRAD